MAEKWTDRFRTDNIANAAQMIDYVHHKIHDGSHYSAGYAWTEGNSIADNANGDIHLDVGACTCHIVFRGTSGGDSEFFFYEGATFSDNGTETTPRNHDRNTADGSSVTAYYDPTVSGTGTLIAWKFFPGGSGPQSGGVEGQSRLEWILKPNTKYLLRLTNRAGTTQAASLIASWYEIASS